MAPKVIISYDGTDNDLDALALGRIFGDAGAKVSLAYVRHAPEAQPDREQLAEHEAEARLDRGAQWLGHPEVGRHVVVSASTGDGLRQLVESEGADLIIFGSDWHTTPGHVQPTRAAMRLLDGSTVAVAVASARLRDDLDPQLTRVALAGGEVNPAARRTADDLAAFAGSPIALPSQDGVDLLVLGSRPGAPEGRVSLSSAAEYLVETARSSVLVLPRGVAFNMNDGAVRVSETQGIEQQA